MNTVLALAEILKMDTLIKLICKEVHCPQLRHTLCDRLQDGARPVFLTKHVSCLAEQELLLYKVADKRGKGRRGSTARRLSWLFGFEMKEEIDQMKHNASVDWLAGAESKGTTVACFETQVTVFGPPGRKRVRFQGVDFDVLWAGRVPPRTSICPTLRVV